MGYALDERADLYSTGIVFYEMLLGKRPYVGRGVTDVLHMHVNAPVPRLPQELRHFQSVLDGLMSKELDQRFKTAEIARAALAAAS